MKPLKTDVPFSTPWFDVVAKTMRPEEEPYYSLRLPEYVAVIALTEDDEVLLVRQYRPAVEQYTLELPSGLVDPGETPAETGRRELLEETGYAAEVEVFGSLFVDTGRLNNRIWGCMAKGARAAEGYTGEPGVELVRCTLEEFWRATRGGQFALSLHVGLLMLAVIQDKLPVR